MGRRMIDWILQAGNAVKTGLALGFTLILVATAQSGMLHNSTEFPGTTKWGGNWGTATGKYGAFTCPTCHTQHSTNIKRIKPSSITNPALINWSSSGTAALTVNFQNVTSMGNDAVSHSTSLRVCEACHSRNKYHNYNSARNTDNSHNNFKDCTGCHPHNIGFKGNESPGGIACATCHNANTLYSTMNADTTTYHHRMQSDAATYPTNATPADTDKRCLQCHVDHNIFRADLNTANTTGRSANLRVDILTAGATGAPGTTYTNTDFVAAATNGGLCVSCHKNVQTKNTANQKTDATTVTPVIPYVGGSKTDFQNSPHQFVATSQFTKDSSTFNANCSKCHDGTFANNYQTAGNQFNNHASTERRISAAMGLSPLTDPVEEKLCYRCHARTTDTAVTNKTTANKDWYGLAAMSSLAELIYNEVTVNTFLHPVNATLGLHKPYDEGLAANDGTLSGANRHVTCSDCHNPHSALSVGSTAAGTTGSVTSYVAGTPDTLTDTARSWTTNQWSGYTVKILGTGTGGGQESAIYGNGTTTLSVKLGTVPTVGSTYIIYSKGYFTNGVVSDGNQVWGSQKGVWGVVPTWRTKTPFTWTEAAAPANPTQILGQYSTMTTWTRVPNATIQGQICIKCHSYYAYGTTPPNDPSGIGTATSSAWSNTIGTTLTETDVSNEFNPNNLGYHPIFARGKNQPIRANYNNTTLQSVTNSNWPKYTGSTIGVSSGVATLTGGTIPKSILPGWFIWVSSITPPTTLTAGTATSGFLEIVSVNSSGTYNVRAETGGTWPSPTYTTAITIASGTACAVTPGLAATFVPPYGPWATIRCTDCHESDTTTDPLGPHGSATKWLLKKAQPQNFITINASGVDTLYTSTPTDAYNLCENCHRLDVYNEYNVTGALNKSYSRQPHPCDTSSGQAFKTLPKWGIICLNCHGGARAGDIHGSNLGLGKSGSASYSGRRLLAGAYWNGITRGKVATTGSCYVKGAADSVANCGNASSGTFATSATYDYVDPNGKYPTY